MGITHLQTTTEDTRHYRQHGLDHQQRNYY